MAKKSTIPAVEKEFKSESEVEVLDQVSIQESESKELSTLPAVQEQKASNLALPFGSDIEGVDLNALEQIQKASSDNIQTGEIQYSRIAIAQPTTPEVAAGEQGWSAGLFFDNISKEILSISGKAPWLLNKGLEPSELKTQNYLPFVPILKLPSEYCLWPTPEERKTGRKMFHWKSLDPSEQKVRDGLWPPKGIWKGEGSPPVTEHINMLGICLNRTGEISSNYIVASFSRTSFNTGKKLITQCQQSRFNKLQYWGRVYYLFTVIKRKDNNTWCVSDLAKGEQLDRYYETNWEDESNWRKAFEATYKHCYIIAKELSDPENGIEKQRGILNAATFGDEMVDDSVTVETTEGATEDPNF